VGPENLVRKTKRGPAAERPQRKLGGLPRQGARRLSPRSLPPPLVLVKMRRKKLARMLRFENVRSLRRDALF